MAEGPIKLKSIASIAANALTATNVLSFREEFMMNIIPQFIPNTYQGLGVLEKAKWRVLTLVFDSDTDVFDLDYFVAAANIPVATTIVVTFTVADAAGTAETWTYQIAKSWIQRKEYGRIEDGASRNTFEYTVAMIGTKLIA